jgi:hypothetical protein
MLHMNLLLKRILGVTVLMTSLISCDKERSVENPAPNTNPMIVGNDCVPSSIASYDSIVPLGSIAALFDASDKATNITQFDSITFTLENSANINYSVAGDTAYINGNEYFLLAPSGLVESFHGLVDPSDPLSLQYDVAYTYNGTGNLTTKSYSLASSPGTPYATVEYTYANGNLTHMSATDLTSGQVFADADITYNSISPRNFMYLFPDEEILNIYNQFLYFGTRSANAPSGITLRFYDPGGTVSTTRTSQFVDYGMSLDGYVLSVKMTGDGQAFIPADAGILKFAYHCP